MSTILLQDLLDNDSDKSFVVPAGVRYHVYYGSVIYVSTAVAGNRLIALEVLDGSSNHIFHSIAGSVQAASGTREYMFQPTGTPETTFRDDHIVVPIPEKLIILPGWTLRIHDENEIDLAADDMEVNFVVDSRELNRFDENAG